MILGLGCAIIIPEGTPTNGCLPGFRKLLRRPWGRMGRSNFFFALRQRNHKTQSLRKIARMSEMIPMISEANKNMVCRASYVTILPPPLLFSVGEKLGGIRPPLWRPFRGLTARYILAQSGKHRKQKRHPLGRKTYRGGLFCRGFFTYVSGEPLFQPALPFPPASRQPEPRGTGIQSRRWQEAGIPGNLPPGDRFVPPQRRRHPPGAGPR